MANVDIANVISMTALQKLSSKRLRKGRTPLFVMDFKSKKKVFVVLDMETFEKLEGHPPSWPSAARGAQQVGADFRKQGLLWDRSTMSNKAFESALRDSKNHEHAWALKRLLEYARSEVVTKILSLAELRKAVAQVSLRPTYKEAWSHAVHYWTQNP